MTVRNSRSRNLLAAGAGVVGLAAASGAVVLGVGTAGSGHAAVGTSARHAALSAASGTCGSTSSTVPSSLPAGASSLGTTTDPRFINAKYSEYQLAGAANADTVPAAGMTPSNALSAHKATRLMVTFTSGVTQLPPSTADPSFETTAGVTVGCYTGRLTETNWGYGPVRIEWIDPAGYHSVFCIRLNTSAGRSGVSDSGLEQAASSLYP